jgi:hypothetical protein
MMKFRYLSGFLAALGVVGAAQAQAQTPAKPFTYLAEQKAKAGQVRAIQTPSASDRIIQTAGTGDKIVAIPAAATAPAVVSAETAATTMSTPSSSVLSQGCAPGSSCPSYACDSPCAPCTPCGPAGRYWVAAEYLYWTTAGNPMPALVTTAPNGNPRTQAGALGAPGTQTLFGGERINNDWRSGFRVRAGMWLDECNTTGFEADYFMLGDSNERASFTSSPGRQIVSRPFFNAVTGQQDTQLVAFPNVLDGRVSVDSNTGFWGVGGNFVKNLCCDPCGRTDLLLGFRYLNLTDETTIREDLTSLPGSQVTPGTRFQIRDSFRTENNIYAVTMGFYKERRFSHYFAGLRGTVGLGWNNQTTEISGSTTITPPGGVGTTYAGGLLTQPSNIGRYSTTRFVVVPEVGVRLGVQLTDNARAYVGYDFLYVSDVVRSGDAIDPRVNTNQIPPSRGLGNSPAVPAFRGNRTDFWAQGITLGLEFRF